MSFTMREINQMKAHSSNVMEERPRLKLSIRHIEEGMVGCGPNRPTEAPSLLLLLAHSLSRTFGDQSPTHNKRGHNREAEQRDRKGRMPHRNPCGYQKASPLSQRDFLENVCKTSTPSQTGTSIRCQTEHLPTLTRFCRMSDFVVWKVTGCFWYPKKRSTFLQGITEVATLPRFHSLHKNNRIHRVLLLTSAVV